MSIDILPLFLADVLILQCSYVSQVKRYIDLYSRTSVIGLPAEDLHHVTQLYTQSESNWSNIVKSLCVAENGNCYGDHGSRLSILQKQIDAYSNFLESIAVLARSAWTEFDLVLMGIGLLIMLASLILHLSSMQQVNIMYQSCYPLPASYGISSKLIFAFLLVVIRGASFLSNSYICESNTYDI